MDSLSRPRFVNQQGDDYLGDGHLEHKGYALGPVDDDEIQRSGPGYPMAKAVPLYGQQPVHNPLDVQINEIATKELRYLAITAIAVATGLIAAQGFIAATVITAAAVIAVYAIQAHAEKAFLNLQDPLTSAAKAQMFAHFHFWAHALMAGTMAGLTGALALSGVLAIAVDNLLLKGSALQIAAWLGLASPAQSAITDVAIFGNDPRPFIAKFTHLHHHLRTNHDQGTLHPSLPAFLLKQYLDKNLTADSLFRQLNAHMAATGVEASVHFTYLAPILSSEMVDAFVQKYQIPWIILVEQLSEEQLHDYTGPLETLGRIEAEIEIRGRGLADNPRLSALLSDLLMLSTFKMRLSTAPFINSRPHSPSPHSDKIDPLRQKMERVQRLSTEIQHGLAWQLHDLTLKLEAVESDFLVQRRMQAPVEEYGAVLPPSSVNEEQPIQMDTDQIARLKRELEEIELELQGLLKPIETEDMHLKETLERIQELSDRVQRAGARLQKVEQPPKLSDMDDQTVFADNEDGQHQKPGQLTFEEV